MKKSNFKQIFLTLALLITAASGAWAAEEETLLTTITPTEVSTYSETTAGIVTITQDMPYYHSDYGWLSTWSTSQACSVSVAANTGYIITRCVFRQNAKNPVTISTAPFAIHFQANGKCEVNSQMDGVTSIEVYGIPPLMPLNSTKTVATMEMPASDVTVEYSLVRDLAQQVTFGGIPTGDGLVVKNNGTAYEFVTAPTFTLTDGLADNADIISAEGITITTQKQGDGDTWTTLDETALAAGYAPGTYRLAATADADGPYDGTIYSAEFTTVEKYDLAIQPADEYSKGKLTEVTVAGTAQTLDAATGKATVTNVAPGAEVKLKANRGYVIEKVEAKKDGASLTYPIALSEVTADYLGSVVTSDGNVYANVADATAASKTAVAMIAYVGNASDCTNGLAIALADESGTNTWSAAGTACSGKTAVTGGTWRLPSAKDWQYMFIGCGANTSYSVPSPGVTKSYSGLASKLSTAGGTALQESYYWSSTENDPGNFAWCLSFGASNATFYLDTESAVNPARAVLAF